METKAMITIVAGGRDFINYPVIEKVLDSFEISTILSGKARGADSVGETYAQRKKIPVWEFPANWNLYKNKAGFLRNKKMAQAGERLIAFWDGRSPGTKNMIFLAKQFKLEVHVFDYEGNPRLPR